MKRIFVVGMLLCSTAMADELVPGYVKKDGTYVQPHYRSSANSNPYDNYSTRGNTNPYTGQQGTQSPYPSYQAPSNPYSQPYQPPANRGQNQQGNQWGQYGR